jgi:serine/threonine-protein kinase
LVIRDNGAYRHVSKIQADFVALETAETEADALLLQSRVDHELRQLGPYRILEQIGQGGMAQVFKGFHPALQREVAIKMLSSHLASDAEFITRFLREAQAVATLRHPNIVQIYDFGSHNGLSYMVMEYVAGGTLQELLGRLTAANQYLPLADVHKIMADVSAALDYAHTRGLVHRDLKPANIMLTGGGHAVLTDFGLARIIGGARQTATGATYGTPAYMSPEQAQGEGGNTGSDIYSLGVILFEIFTNRLPFEADTPMAFLMKQIQEPPPAPSRINPAIPEPVNEIVLRALSKDPLARYSTAGEFNQALVEAFDWEVESQPGR